MLGHFVLTGIFKHMVPTLEEAARTEVDKPTGGVLLQALDFSNLWKRHKERLEIDKPMTQMEWE